MSERNVGVVQDMYGAFAEGDVPGVLAAMDPAIEWNEAESFPYADGNPYVGPDAIVAGVFQRLVDEWTYWDLDVERVLDAGDHVLATGRYRAENKATGKEIDAQFAHLWTFADGRVVRFQQYADTAQVRDAVAGG